MIFLFYQVVVEQPLLIFFLHVFFIWIATISLKKIFSFPLNVFLSIYSLVKFITIFSNKLKAFCIRTQPMRRIQPNTTIDRNQSDVGMSSKSFRVKATLASRDKRKKEKALFLLFISFSEMVYFWGNSMVFILAQIRFGLTFFGFRFNHYILPLWKKDGDRQYAICDKT